MTVAELYQQTGSALKRVSDSESCGPCPRCKGKDRFVVWVDKDRYWCRQCGFKGDGIQFCRDFMGMSYPKTCRYLGTEPRQSTNQYRRQPSRGDNRQESAWQAKKITLPGDLWMQKAGECIAWANNQLLNSAKGEQALNWLRNDRGLSDDTIRRAGLGWNPIDMRLERGLFGLNGNSRKLWVPSGLTIPTIINNGSVAAIKIRLPQPPSWNPNLRYYAIPGSASLCLIIPARADVNACCVLESALDGWLVSQEAGDLVWVVVLGSASMRPDEAAMALLKDAGTILVSLDRDPAGATQVWGFWRQNFPNAKRWPCVGGKDPGEAWKDGLNLRAWIEAGLLPGGKEGKSEKIDQELSSGIPDGNLITCGECGWFDRMWCTNPDGSWNKRRGQELAVKHSCPRFTPAGATKNVGFNFNAASRPLALGA
jgi:DNA primase